MYTVSRRQNGHCSFVHERQKPATFGFFERQMLAHFNCSKGACYFNMETKRNNHFVQSCGIVIFGIAFCRMKCFSICFGRFLCARLGVSEFLHLFLSIPYGLGRSCFRPCIHIEYFNATINIMNGLS